MLFGFKQSITSKINDWKTGLLYIKNSSQIFFNFHITFKYNIFSLQAANITSKLWLSQGTFAKKPCSSGTCRFLCRHRLYLPWTSVLSTSRRLDFHHTRKRCGPADSFLVPTAVTTGPYSRENRRWSSLRNWNKNDTVVKHKILIIRGVFNSWQI